MSQSRKRYGYTIALWERGETAASLFAKLSQHFNYPRTPLWNSMMSPSYFPWPLRPALSLLRNRDARGDVWNMCHFWSNFEIADMDFFRSEAYRDMFDFLDKDGGFYYERWGDAPVHSLAAAVLLEPWELHHFSDVGYVHGGLQYCPPKREGERERLGCECECDERVRQVEGVCLGRIRSTVE